VIFGGYDGGPRDDTWEWNGSAGTWTAVSGGIRPPARAAHALAFDALRGRVVLFGGYAEPFAGTVALQDTWELAGP
jgi:hypothetical protein